MFSANADIQYIVNFIKELTKCLTLLIITASKRFFIEKGYEATKIQDIVDELGGLTKGAIYHHYKSKEEIIKALGTRLLYENNPFDTIKGRNDLNALQKIQEVMVLCQADEENMSLNEIIKKD